MARIYSASRIVFNRSIRNDVNMRVFEALACGSLLVTNDLADNGQDELFQDGVHLATYRDPEELLEKVAYYLAHEEEREPIAAAGRAEALARHTYRHRMERLLAEAGGKLGGWRDASGGLERRAIFGCGDADVGVRSDGHGVDTPYAACFAIPRPRSPVLSSDHRALLEPVRVHPALPGRAHPPHPRPWELIVVDNGSTDGTADYLAGVQDAAPCRSP